MRAAPIPGLSPSGLGPHLTSFSFPLRAFLRFPFARRVPPLRPPSSCFPSPAFSGLFPPALFETGMPILGRLLGRSLARTLGRAAHWIGAALLIATGIYALVQAVRSRNTAGSEHQGAAVSQHAGQLLVIGLRSAWTIWPSASPSAPTMSAFSWPRLSSARSALACHSQAWSLVASSAPKQANAGNSSADST